MNNYILGIDGSTVATGWNIMDKDTKELIAYGVFKKDGKEEPIMRKRIGYMIDSIRDIILQYNPNEIIMEDVPPSVQNSMTVLALGILSGGIMGLANYMNIPISYVLPNVWHSDFDIKKSKGDLKEQSINWVNKKFNTDLIFVSPSSKKNQDNESDSICLSCWKLGYYDKPNRRGFKKG